MFFIIRIILIQLLLLIYIKEENCVNGKKFLKVEERISDFNDIKNVYNVYPLRYFLNIQSDLHRGDLKFNGTVTIKFLSLTNENSIIESIDLDANSDDIEILEITSGKKNKHPIKFQHENNKLKLFNLNNGNPKFRIKIKFIGKITNKKFGFNYLTYKDENGKIHYNAATHLEENGASSLMPCIDDRIFKSTFKLSVKHHKDYRVLSNSEIANEIIIDSEYKKIKFKPIKLMSIYLFAIAINDFIEVQGDGANSNYKMYIEPKYKNSSKFILNHSDQIMKALESFLNIKYSLNKLDQLLIEKMFGNAMENWGLIIYQRDTYIFEEYIQTTIEKIKSLQIICHEFSHQFFGNLVTAKNQSCIWLNEGLATYFERLLLDLIYSNEKYSYYHLHHTTHAGFYYDSDGVDFPIYNTNKYDITERMYIINYKKSGSILWMFHHILGNNTLKQALKYYLKYFKYTSVDNHDFYQALRESIKGKKINDEIDIGIVFDSWNDQFGYPLLNVTRNYETGDINLYQERFLKGNVERVKKLAKWWLPYNYAYRSNIDFEKTTPDGWLANIETDVLHLNLSNNDWIIMNKQQTGFYIVNYDRNNWNLIKNELFKGNHEIIHPLNRAQLLHDSYNLAQNDYIDYDIPINLMLYLTKEKHYIPWVIAEDIFKTLEYKIPNSELLKTFIKKLTKNLYNEFKFNEINENYPENHQITQYIVIHQACKSGNQNCIEDAKKAAKTYLNFNNDPPLFNDKFSKIPEFHRTILCYGIETNDEFKIIWNKLKYNLNNMERVSILKSFSCQNDKELFRDIYIKALFFNEKFNYLSESELLTLKGQIFLSLNKGFGFFKYMLENNINGIKDPENNNMLTMAVIRFFKTMDSQLDIDMCRKLFYDNKDIFTKEFNTKIQNKLFK